MRVLLKLILVLFYVQRGEGHFLPSLIDHKQETESSSHNGDESAEASGLGASGLGASELGASGLGASELGASGLLASEPSPAPLVPARSRRSALNSPCGLRSVLIQVRHLGLGYDSDETVLFKYCSGTCPHARNNHDLTLSNLLQSGVLPGEVREHHHTPCCRPTLHEDIAFLDNSHRWHKVEKLSAAGCSCVG